MKKNQLTRALRIDKFTAATLELVLQEYLSEEKAVQNIPVLRMLSESQESVAGRAHRLCGILKERKLPVKTEVKPCESQIGGGSLPLERIPSTAVTIRPEEISVNELEERMRRLPIPIIPRTVNDEILLDMRTVSEQEINVIAGQLAVSGILEK